MANEETELSFQGLLELRHSEGLRTRNYNDQGNNCTVGAGVLVHYGPCSVDELDSVVDPDSIDRRFNRSIEDAVRRVRRAVTRTELTQEQFDAAVSFVYNTGVTRPLRFADQGRLRDTAREMRKYVVVCERDASGGKIPGSCKVSKGLENRRLRETRSYRDQL